MLDRACAVHARTALRPEPFGALAYHYDHRTLMFLRHPDLLDVVRRLDGQRTVREVLEDVGVARSRWHSFDVALARLLDSQLIVEPARHEC